MRVTLDHVEAHDRDDARHHRAPSWQPSNTPQQNNTKLRVGCARSSRSEYGWAQQEVPTLNATWVGGGRDAVGALDGRLPCVGSERSCSSPSSSEPPSQRQTFDHLAIPAHRPGAPRYLMGIRDRRRSALSQARRGPNGRSGCRWLLSAPALALARGSIGAEELLPRRQ